MSLRYKGAVISATPPTTTGGNSGTAPGAWTLQQQLQAQGAGNWPNQPVWYIEDVFSTWLYTGNGSTQTITNGIDLSTYGGLVWQKSRSDATNNGLSDTAQGPSQMLFSNLTNASSSYPYLSSFNSNGYTVGNAAINNFNGSTFVSWTFRKQPKFFDVVTYTGNYTARTIAHSLGSVPGCIIVKKTSSADDWRVYHRSLATNQYMTLETTAAVGTSATMWNNTAPTSTVFSIGAEGSVNDPGETFVAYLFAHDAGGFGLTGTDNVISCGSYTGNGSTTGPVVTLGYEPQWVMVKRTDLATNWVIFDTMRGMSLTASMLLYPNLADDEGIGTQSWISPTATGFQPAITNGTVNANGGTYIYIAIRRGPMKTPTSGTSVFAANQTPSTNIGNVGFPVDLGIMKAPGVSQSWLWGDRLRGWNTAATTGYILYSDTTGAENSQFSGSGPSQFDVQNGFGTALAYTSYNFWNFRRAPGFFDEVCWTATSSLETKNHNLGVQPELVIYKARSTTSDWFTLFLTPLVGPQEYSYLYLNTTASAVGFGAKTQMTSTTFAAYSLAGAGATNVAYLFASCPGVSKVGTYTGTGATQTISCGFAARFVMIKRTDSTGNWWTWNTASGMVAGTDPRMAFNSPAAESNANWVYTDASGFQIVTTDATVNASGGSYIYLAIA